MATSTAGGGAAPFPETTAASPPTATKLSRYRSVRRAQQAQQSSPVPVPDVPEMPILPTTSLGKLMNREREKTRERAKEDKEEEGKTQEQASVGRSMSRYHRRPTTSHAKPPLPTPGTNARSTTNPTPALPISASSTRPRAISSPQSVSAHNGTANDPVPRLPPNTSRSRSDEHSTPLVEGKTGREPSRAARDEAKMLLEKEAERQRRLHEKIKAEKRARLEAAQAEAEKERREKGRIEQKEKAAAAAAAAEEAERTRAEREAKEKLQRERDEQERGRRLQKAAVRKVAEEEEAAAAAARRVRSPPTSPRRHGGALGLFGRRRKDDVSTSPEPAASTAKLPQTSSDALNRDVNTIRPGGGGAVLGIDAPKSAINAGDRRVLIVCNKQEILLPVTPTTTSLDLIKSAANCLTEPIQVRTAVLLECFQKVGLQRPLRNYEHVRDVMNSWDDDKQNDLLIVDSAAKHIDQDELLALRVPESKPDGMSCYIHHSSKPGKWSKRYFTLSRDGQLSISKNENSKDSENICHLSDFDIYSPTEKKLSKVKPPKKICYAVKSQQKSNIYLDETRFVHFFCTNDKNIATLFYKTIQTWRSWYLIHVMGEGQKKTESPETKPLNGLPGSRNASGNSSQTAASGAHKRHSSVESHYQLGSFKPLDLNLDLFGKDKDDAPKTASLPEVAAAPTSRVDTHTMYARKMSTRAKGPPPLSYNLSAIGQDSAEKNSRQNSLTSGHASESEGDTFAPGGLLGRKYSEKQKALQEKEQKQQVSKGPFTDGPSLINQNNWGALTSGNDGGVSRQRSVQGHHRRTSSDIQRSMSTRNRPKPLVDLTPQYKEPPQHQRKGKGIRPEDVAGPLVENATSPEEAIKVPPSTDWRQRPSTARPNHGTYGTGNYERTRSLRGRGEGLAAYTVNNHTCAPEDDSNAFTGGGLLARAGFSQGHTKVGHGVMDGSKARGPMLDLREDNKFAAGSLLASVERQNTAGAGNRRQSVDLGG